MGVYSIDSSFFPDDSIDSSFFPDELIIESVCRVLSFRIKWRVKEFGCLFDTVKTSNGIDSMHAIESA